MVHFFDQQNLQICKDAPQPNKKLYNWDNESQTLLMIKAPFFGAFVF